MAGCRWDGAWGLVELQHAAAAATAATAAAAARSSSTADHSSSCVTTITNNQDHNKTDDSVLQTARPLQRLPLPSRRRDDDCCCFCFAAAAVLHLRTPNREQSSGLGGRHRRGVAAAGRCTKEELDLL